MFKLNERTALVKKKKRVGRGGSRGGTAGKGHKGQKARSGAGRKLNSGFEGGQMPLHRRLPKRGFNNELFREERVFVTLDQLEQYFEVDQKVTKDLLCKKGLIKSSKAVVKLLANGQISKKLTLEIDACSSSALEKITACGGNVTLIKGA